MAVIKLVIFGSKWKAPFSPEIEAKMLDCLGKRYGYQDTIPNPPGDPIPNPVSQGDHVALSILDEILKNAKAKEIEEVFKAAAIEARASAADAFDAIPIETDV
jgi:hypothetical protein